MNTGLWIVQILLGLVFLTTGVLKVLFYEQGREHSKFIQVTAKPMVMVIGTLEILGAFGVILPAATGILPWLTPLAAVGLALTMLVAFGFNLKYNEARRIPVNVVLLLMALFVVYGRFAVVPQ